MDTLIAIAIHDAKNELTTLNAWLYKAQHEQPSVALTEAQAVATRVGAQLVELLTLYRENEGTLRLAIDDHDLPDFCADLFAEFPLPPDSSITFESHVDAADEIGAWAFDAYQVKFVLLDALRNAARNARGMIFFRLEQTNDGICFSVNDDGPGFPAEILQGAETAMNTTSSGLGLRFARLIAKRHATPNGRHGHVDLDNAAGGGAIFRLCLP